MQQASTHKPLTLNLDKAFADLTSTESFYLLNHERLLNIKGRVANNQGVGKPVPANFPACDIVQPGGENYVIGGHRSPLTNELYSFHYNSNGVHYILRINNSGCEVVYVGCLDDFSAEPQHSIEQWRGFMWIEKICANRHGKQLIWVNGNGDIHQLDVEASIATDFFTTPFFQTCGDPCSYVKMCVPEICGCIQAEFIPLDLASIGMQNNILDQPFQFAVKHVYYDNRESEWSDRSTIYYQNARGCFDTTEGLPRCMKLRVPVGNPMVDRIKIGYTADGVNWFITEIVDKYKKYNNTQEKWYDRKLSEIVAPTFSASDCSFDYIFCNDKNRIPIDPKEISRVRNPIPSKAQGMIPVKDSLGFYNYEDGNCPIDRTEIQKFAINLDCNASNVNCVDEYVTITVRAVIHDYVHSRNQFVWRQNGSPGPFGVPGTPDDLTETAYFGDIQAGNHVPLTSYGQNFIDKTRNFIAYIEADEYWGEMKQWYVRFGNFAGRKETPVVAGMNDGSYRENLINSFSDGTYFFQEAKIKVLRGTRGFLRLASHGATNGQGTNQNRSTFVNGVINSIANYRGDLNLSQMNAITDYSTKEIYFDSCGGDVTLEPVFVISDNSEQALMTGYIVDANNLPIEGAIIGTQQPTDHNGFYHFSFTPGAVSAPINVELDCITFGNIQTFSQTGTVNVENANDIVITSTHYKDDLYLIVRAKVIDCNGQPVAGVRVAISGSKYRTTDASGTATFHLRNYSTRNRQVRIVVMNGRGCLERDCSGNCNPCMPTFQLPAPVCYDRKPTLIMNNSTINTASITSGDRGLKLGGRYPFGIVAQGNCGKLSAVYEVRYFDIPKAQATNIQAFCSFTYNGNGITLPAGFDCLKIVRGININPFELQWKVDKIEKTIDGKIKITIQSLNDYNKQYNFKTNTVYQWAKDDRIEFIKNGDGTILTTAQFGLLNYLSISPFNDEIISGETDPPADFFNQLLIIDDGRLDMITEGAIIELQRPLKNIPPTIYYEICATIDVKSDGTLLNPTGTFTTFDTYLVNRNIGSFVWTFEHHSPSDFWGNKVSDVGKAHVVNKFENERRYGRNISLNSPTQFNYFGDLIKTFNAPEQGDIIAMSIKDGRIIAAICEKDNFIAESADELVRVGGDGIIRALPPDSIISDAQAKLSGTFGCQYPHIGSIYFGDGYFTWTDVNSNDRVLHDYNSAKSVSDGRTATYYKIRCQQFEKHNRSTTNPLDKYRFANGFDSSTGMLYETIKRLRDSGFNNDRKAMVSGNTTIKFHPVDNEWYGFASFTPEFYGNFDLFDDAGCAFVAYLNSIPYFHPIITTRFNEFFGIACDEIMGITINKFPEKMKEGLSIEIQSDMLWFTSEVTTEKSTFISEIPAIKWKKDRNKWNASFLFNKNSRAGLYGNGGGVPEPTTGQFINVTLIRDNTDALKYGTIDNAKRIKYNETDLIFSKFALIEQTGFTNNL